MLSPSSSHSEDQLTAMITQLKDVLAKYPPPDVFSKDSLADKVVVDCKKGKPRKYSADVIYSSQ